MALRPPHLQVNSGGVYAIAAPLAVQCSSVDYSVWDLQGHINSDCTYLKTLVRRSQTGIQQVQWDAACWLGQKQSQGLDQCQADYACCGALLPAHSMPQRKAAEHRLQHMTPLWW